MQAAVEDSLAESASAQEQQERHRKTLQVALDCLEPGALVNTTAPANGSCLFHALTRGGLTCGIPGGLSVAQLRRVALSIASDEQLSLAALSTGLSKDEYIKGIKTPGWGDELMVALLAKGFSCSITVVGANTERTYHSNGDAVQGSDPNSIWICHAAEWHYFGVVRG